MSAALALVTSAVLSLPYGTPFEGYPNTPQTVTAIGSGPHSVAPTIAYKAQANRAPQVATAFWIRVGQTYGAAQFLVSWNDQYGTLATTTTVTLSPDSWNQITPPVSVVIYGEETMLLEGLPGSEAEFVNRVMELGYTGTFMNFPGFGSDPIEYTSYRYQVPDGGYQPWNLANLVVELSSIDPWAPGSCQQPVFAASGDPYVKVVAEPIANGSSATQVGVDLDPDPNNTCIAFVSSLVDPGTASSVTLELTGAGAPTVDAPLFPPANNLPTGNAYVSWPFPAGAFPTGFQVRIIPDGGDITLERFTADAPWMDECHPVARATSGGTLSHALLDGGGYDSDFSFRYMANPTATAFADDDEDGYGDPSKPIPFCYAGSVPLGVSLNSNDCDDTNGAIHPGAAEVCNGADDDCNGLVDTADPGLVVATCELTQGVCSGAQRTAAGCVNGAWVPCDYGPSYEAVERSCDGLDNDCNGLVDSEDPGLVHPPCELQAGVCAGAIHGLADCAPTGWVQCSELDYGPYFQTPETRCDGLDNDCDGLVDEPDGLDAPACELQLGVCAGARHAVTQCVDGGWMPCGPPEYGPDYQLVESGCDGLDNDCDGRTDEACPSQLPAASTSLGSPAHTACGCSSDNGLMGLAALVGAASGRRRRKSGAQMGEYVRRRRNTSPPTGRST